GEPQTMQKNPTYGDVVAEIRDYLNARVAACEAAGIDRSEIAIDPGIGFGKTIDHNLTLVNELDAFGDMGCPVLLGLSRKSFIARLSRGEEPKDRMPGSLAGALAGVARGASILRVHDVADTCQAVAVWQAISQAE
ncbi:MAG: dihydropteroate synthase, partial [Rhodospirillales bacterium]|nr:dihydropteroate synthase [Rhodospirillales bacterium]